MRQGKRGWNRVSHLIIDPSIRSLQTNLTDQFYAWRRWGECAQFRLSPQSTASRPGMPARQLWRLVSGVVGLRGIAFAI
jgi:hypothetical protein